MRSMRSSILLREWSLITRRGSYKTEGGGANKVLPLQKGGRGTTSFSHAEGGGGGDTTSFEVVLTRELEVLAVLIGGGGRERFPPFKTWQGGAESFTLS